MRHVNDRLFNYENLCMMNFYSIRYLENCTEFLCELERINRYFFVYFNLAVHDTLFFDISCVPEKIWILKLFHYSISFESWLWYKFDIQILKFQQPVWFFMNRTLNILNSKRKSFSRPTSRQIRIFICKKKFFLWGRFGHPSKQFREKIVEKFSFTM